MKTVAPKAVELKDEDLDAAVGGLAASGTGNVKTQPFKVEIEGVKSPTPETASFDEADALFGKRSG
jgi:hypothetical protein